MKLTNLLTNQNLSERLKKLGVVQKSIFFWRQNQFMNNEWQIFEDESATGGDGEFSAFLSGELGELLSEGLEATNKCAVPNKGKWRCVYTALGKEKSIAVYGETEADARGEMLQYLLENHIISVDEINRNMEASKGV